MQIQNQRGRDDTIDPYYLMNVAKKGSGGNGTTLTYTLERKIGSNGEIYYQLIESDGTTFNPTGVNITFAAEDLLYNNSETISSVLAALAERDSELQEALDDLAYVAPTQKKTFEELEISSTNASLSDIIAAIAAKNLDSNVLVVGQLDASALPAGLSSADVEIKQIESPDGTFYEVCAYSDTVSPYKWTALYKDDEELLGWTDAYNGGSDAQTITNLQTALESHAENNEIHITSEERLAWNSHVGVQVDSDQGILKFKH